MSKIKNTGITNKWGFRHTCYVAKQSKILKISTILVYLHDQEAKIKFWVLDDFSPDSVALTPKYVRGRG